MRRTMRRLAIGVVALLSTGAFALLPASTLFGPQPASAGLTDPPPTVIVNTPTPDPATLGTPVDFTVTLGANSVPGPDDVSLPDRPPFTSASISLSVFSDSTCSTLAFTLNYPPNPGDLTDQTYDLGTYTPAATGTYYGYARFSGTDARPQPVEATSTYCQELVTVTNVTTLTTHSTTRFASNFFSETVTFYATLTSGGVPVAGQTIEFTQTGYSGQSCTGMTNGSGVATCQITEPTGIVFWNPKYKATFAGAGAYAASSATGKESAVPTF
jgi:hypothetical protein